jgi:hypothetical protein
LFLNTGQPINNGGIEISVYSIKRAFGKASERDGIDNLQTRSEPFEMRRQSLRSPHWPRLRRKAETRSYMVDKYKLTPSLIAQHRNYSHNRKDET